MSLRQIYTTTIVPKLQEVLGDTNALAVPRVEKIVVSVGVGKNLREEKDRAVVTETLRRITGQQPVFTKAKKSISGFKLRQGALVGAKVTLRGSRMYDFLEKLVHVTLPRVRDFRGLDSKSVDANGHCTLGLREHIVFPEIRSDEVERLHGVAVTIHTTAGNRERALALLHVLGFPFKK